MIFVDSNIPMYLVGSEHPNKDRARRLLEDAVGRGERLVTSTEVFQEILQRYASINRPDAIQPCFDLLLGVVDDVFPIGLDDVQRAKEIVLGAYALSARDALHVGVMNRENLETIMSFDLAFDRYPGLRRRA